MKKAGRVSLLSLIVIAVVLIGGAVVLLLIVPDSPESAATQFFSALATGNVDKLVSLSDMGDETPDQVRAQWQFATHDAGKYYQFIFQVDSSSQTDATDASVKVQMLRNPDKPGGYMETFDIPMVKKNDGWKVDVRAVNRTIYPALPE
ncbi:MAG TPA: DUF2950 family protein [Fimbriimonadaceae bacterium]|jgi:hypothetical protein